MTQKPDSVAEAIVSAQGSLVGAGVDSPRLDAQLLLAWAMKLTREQLAAQPERIIPAREAIIFSKAVELRCLRRPLPYITGEAWFYGRQFKVNRAVLIPRSETEMIVDFAKSILKDAVNARVADIGTGSGCIAVSVALDIPGAKIDAVDLSRLAQLVAAKNVKRYGLNERVALLEGDLLTPLGQDGYDLIVSNPPYVSLNDKKSLMPEVRDYEPEMALFGADAKEDTPHVIRREILEQAKGKLKPGGWVAIEIGQGQEKDAAETAIRLAYDSVRVEKDMAGIGRLLIARLPCSE